MNELINYRDKLQSFGTPLAQAAISKSNPAEWWISYGSSAPALQRIAVRVLSQTTSSSNCERNWSTFSLIHTKKRNRLKHKKLQKLVYVHYNMRLKIRQIQRKSAKEIELGFNPINLDNIFEEEDPLHAWLEERENATLDGEENPSWLPAELLDDTDDEGTEGVHMDAISPNVSNEENVHQSTSENDDDDEDDDDDGDDDDDDDGGTSHGYQMETGHTYFGTSHGYQGMGGYYHNVDPGLFPTNASGSSQNISHRDGRTRERLSEHFHDPFAYSSSRSLATDENEISESSSQSFHSYLPDAFPHYLGQNPNFGYFSYNLPHPMQTDTSYGYDSINPHFTYNVRPPSYSRGDQNQGREENSDALDPPRHSFWW